MAIARCLMFSAMLLMMVCNTGLAQNSGDHKSKAELAIFARFHAVKGNEEAVAAELRDAVRRVRQEPGCLYIEVFRSVSDQQQFFLHSRWTDEAAFNRHANLPETNRFVERMQRLIDHPFDVVRARALD